MHVTGQYWPFAFISINEVKRSRSHGYENRHGRKCCVLLRPCAAAAGVGLHVDTTACFLVIPAKAREYVFTGVGLCVCVSVCDHDD